MNREGSKFQAFYNVNSVNAWERQVTNRDFAAAPRWTSAVHITGQPTEQDLATRVFGLVRQS